MKVKVTEITIHMKICIIKVQDVRFVGLFVSTCAAVSYAIAQFPEAKRISAYMLE